jgi:tetratricopeptide (TPR) repeat protein
VLNLRTSRPRYILALAALAALAALIIPVAIAQSSRRAPAGLQDATRALLQGRYDEVDAVTAKLGLQDPFVAAVKARALVARGQYGEAEALLRPLAQAAPTSEAALEMGLLMQKLGRAEATPLLTRVASIAALTNEPQELARGARALRALGRAQEANAAFRDAAAGSPRDLAIQAAWGELFLEKFQNGEALKSFQMVLREDPKYGPALLGAARALASENPPQARQFAEQALAANPADVGALLFLAGQSVDAGKRDEARESIRKALAVNPSSLEARSLLAALAFVEDKKAEFDAEVAKVLAVSPTYGEVYRSAAELASHNYRFEEAVALARRGLEIDPRNARLLKELGGNLLRTGDEPAAREALEASFAIDDFDVVTFNLLQMMDRLDTFVTVEDGDLILRMDRAEAPILQEHVLGLAKQAMSTLSKRYQFTPQGPILIEMFPKHDDFAVRNFGLPGMIGALGVCFGRVVTLDSPKARPPGDFQWEATLWHELAHVFTIQMSKQRVPRWLTEGVSVHEETVQRREWGRSMEVMFAGLLNRGETIKLTELNAAFQNPETISLAYYQASLLVAHIIERFGDAGLHKLVRAYGDGLDSDEALRTALNTSFGDLQDGFDQMLERRFGAMRAALKVPEKVDLLKIPLEALRPLAAEHASSYPVQLVLGNRLREAGETDEALAAFERAAALLPLAAGEDTPHRQIATLALETKDVPKAVAALQALLHADAENLDAARQLASLLREQKTVEASVIRPVYERIVALDPWDADARVALGRLALQAGDTEKAIREFRTVVALGPVDQAAAYTDLAESYFRGGRRAEARKHTLAALEIAPGYERAQDLLLEIAGERP